MKKSFTNIFSGALGFIIPMALNIFTTPFIIKELGSEAYGIQSLVNVIIGFLMVADMGLDIPVTRAVAEYKGHRNAVKLNKLLNSTLQIYFFIGLAGLVIIGISTPALVDKVFKVPANLRNEATYVFYFAGLGFVGGLFNMWGKSILNGLLRYDISNGINIVSNILSLIIGAVFVFYGYGVAVYVLIRVLFSFLSGLAFFIISKNFLSDFSFSTNINIEVWHSLKSQIGYGFLLRLAGIVTTRLDQTLIGIWIGVAAVGFYSIPILIIASVGGLINSMTHYLFPQISELNSKGKREEIKRLFCQSTRYIGMLIFFIYTPLLVFGSKFLFLWVGPQIAGNTSAVLFLLLIAAMVSMLTCLLTNAYLVAIGKLDLVTKYIVLRAIIMGIALIFLLKPLGLIGAGWAMIVASILDFPFYFYIVSRYLKFNPIVYFAGFYTKLFAISIVAGGIIDFFYVNKIQTWPTFILGALFFVVLFVLLCIMFRVFNQEEKEMFNKVKSRLLVF